MGQGEVFLRVFQGERLVIGLRKGSSSSATRCRSTRLLVSLRRVCRRLTFEHYSTGGYQNVRVLPVQKHRIQFEFPIRGTTLLLEIAEIVEPQKTYSIGLEEPNLGVGVPDDILRETFAAMTEARDALAFPGTLIAGGYLEKMREWVELLAGRPS